MDLKRTPFYDRLAALGAKFVPYAGFEMPVRFGAITDEHLAVRRAAGLFDVSHMSEFWFEGREALTAVNRLVTNDLRRAKDGDMQYSCMCTPSGGTVDDLMAYRFSETKILLVMNAACHDQDVAHIREHLTGDVTFADRSDETAQLALQGPLAVSIFSELTDGRYDDLQIMTFTEGPVAGVPCLISRSGYTGEDGYEIYCPTTQALPLFDALMATGVPRGLLPIGLGARDTLRLEAKMPLYGNELSFDITPLEAKLGWAVSMDKPDFVGQAALAQQKANGCARHLVGFEMQDRHIGRHGYAVVDPAAGNAVVGTVTSGSPSPFLEKNIGLAYLPSRFRTGMDIGIDIRGKIHPAKIVKTPFYKRSR